MNDFSTLNGLDHENMKVVGFERKNRIIGRAADISASIVPLGKVKADLRSRYLVKGWLDRGAFSVVYAQSNVGKTFFAMDLALHVAAGADWHGNRVPNGEKYAGSVLYVAAEGGRGIRTRIEAMRKHNPDMMDAIELSGNLSILSQPLDLCTANDAQYLIEAVTEGFEVMPSLIVVDTLARVMGNSRLVLAISAALAAPLLEITGDDGGGFHFRGASSSGKSTALAVAGSVWGGGGRRGAVKSWRVTDNGLEALAALHNDACLCLDELSQVDSRAAGAAAYMLGNGAGKSRAGRDGQARRAYEWRLIFISNGETGLADKIGESGGRIAAGMEVRVIDLRADAGAGFGLFEELHGAENAASFAQALKAAAGQYYGTPARCFLQKVVSTRDELPGGIASLRDTFLKAAVPEGADGQVSRVASRFALVAAAGELASSMGVTGWPEGVALDAALRCFRDWLTERGGIGAGEIADAKNRLRQAIEVDGSSRFLPWHRDPRVVLRSKTLGYLRRSEDGEEDQPPIYYVHSSGMNEILAGLDRRTVLEGLASEGIIVRQQEKSKGKAKSVLTKIFKVPSENTGMRLYQLDFAALTGGIADDAG